MNTALLLAQLTLLAFSLLGVATASPEDWPKHALQCVVALLITIGVAQLKPGGFVRMGPWLWGLTIVALTAALFIGHGPGHVRRSIDIGPLSFVPAEFAKLALIAYLASFFIRKGSQYKLIGPVIVIGVTSALIFLSPDFEAGILVFTLALGVMFVSGVGLLRIISIVALAGCAAFAASSLYLGSFKYITERFSGFLKINSGSADPLAEGYQLSRSLRVLTNGGLWGQGPDQHMLSVPAAHTDMIVISIVHASGLIGVTCLLVAYTVILVVGLQIARRALALRQANAGLEWQYLGASVLAAGGTLLILGQAVLNLGVAIGLIPNTGVALPLVSYGLSSQATIAVALGWIHAAHRQSLGWPARVPRSTSRDPLEEAVV